MSRRNPFSRLAHRLRSKERRSAAPAARSGALREFAYLDDVSVVSLFSSRFGALPETRTTSEKESRSSEVSGEGGVSVSAISGKLSSRASASEDHGVEILSKSNIQAHFRELLDVERSNFVMEPADGALPPAFVDANDRVTHDATEGPLHWLVHEDQLSRGALIEVEVELEASKLFSLRTLMSTMSELGEISPSMTGGPLAPESSSAREVIDRLLVDLIPIRCVAVDYRVIDTSLGSFLIHRKLLDQIAPDERPQSAPLAVVGLTEERLYWKDIRRIVFSGGRYRMLARVSQDNLKLDWVEVKFLDLLAVLNPAMSSTFADVLRTAVQGAVQESHGLSQASAESSAFVRLYWEKAVATLAARPDDESYALIELLAQGMNATTPDERDVAARAVDKVIESSLGITLETERAEEIREEATVESGVLSPTSPPPGGEPKDKRLANHLEVEIIALYW